MSISAPCSPRTRGWSLSLPDGGALMSVLPAHAGMVPVAP